jgi:uncharacterized protein YkwD
MSLDHDDTIGVRHSAPNAFWGSLLVAAGVGFLVLSSALFLGQNPVAGSAAPLDLSMSGGARNSDAVILLASAGPAFDSADSRLTRVEKATAVPTPVAQPPLLPAGAPAAEAVVAPLPVEPSPAPAVIPVQPAPTSPPLPPPPTPTLAPPPAPAVQPVTLTSFENDIAVGINNERAAAGLAPLQVDASLVEVGRERSNDMIKQGYFGHVSPTGETAFSLLDKYGIPYSWAGENLARNNYPADQCVAIAMHDWMASEGHRENILNPHYTAMGIGGAVDASGMYYFTTVFTGP